MVDYITTDFSNVRGGGNIKTQTPISEDFITEAVLSDVSDGVYVLSLLSEVHGVDLNVSTNEFHVGETSTFTAVVYDENDDPLESENVVFKVGGHIVGSAITNSSGVATYTYTGESYGDYNLIALSKGVRSNIEILSISKPMPTITLTASAQTVEIGNPVTLTGNSSNYPDKQINIYDGDTLIAYAYNDGNGDFNKKLYLSQGAHILKAVSVADDDYSIGESTPVLVTVNDGEPPVVSGIGLITDKSSIYAYSGEYATLSATVLDQNSNPVSDVEVEFFDGEDSIGTATTNSLGVATKSFSSNTVGVHTLTAECGNVSSIVSVTVNSKPVPTISLSSSSASATYGTSITLSGTLSVGSGISVKLYDGNTLIDTLTTGSGGAFSYTSSSIGVGNHSYTAVFEGNSSYDTVTSSSVSVTITKITSTISLSAVSSNITVGDSPQLNGTLSVGSGESVKIYLGDTLADTVTTGTNGAFSFTGSATSTSGSLTFKAVYDGDSTHSSVTSSNVVITVSGSTPVVTSVSLSSDKSVLSAYDSESAVLSATVLDQSSNPMSGETVTFYKGSTSIGTATTNSSGIATKSYSATGSGDVTFKATCESIDSSTITVEDCIFYGLNTNAFTIPSSTTFSSNGTYITASTSTNGEKIVTLNHTLANADNWVFENEVAYTGTSEQLLAIIWNDSTYYGGHGYGENYVYSYMGSQTKKTHTVALGDKFIVRRENGTTSVYINDELIESKTVSHKSSFKVGYFINKGRTQYYKNIKLKAL